MLPPEHPFFNGSPAGSPNGWRVSAGFSTANIKFGNFQEFFPNQTSLSTAPVTLAMAGPSVSGGLQKRWFTLLLDARYLKGETTGARTGLDYGPAQPVVGSLSEAASFSLWDVGFRLGPRIPLEYVSLAGGPGLSAGSFSSTPAATTSSSTAYIRPYLWAGLEAQPLCDFGLGGGVQYGAVGLADKGNSETKGEVGLFIHVAYEPNTMCDRERDGLYRLHTENGPPRAAATRGAL
jgi:hypothetical protein